MFFKKLIPDFTASLTLSNIPSLIHSFSAYSYASLKIPFVAVQALPPVPDVLNEILNDV